MIGFDFYKDHQFSTCAKFYKKQTSNAGFSENIACAWNDWFPKKKIFVDDVQRVSFGMY